MLKPAGDEPERSFGELASQLMDDAKGYARAELDLAKAIAAEKSRSLRTSAILFGAAFLVAIGAISALSVALFVALAMVMNVLLAGLLAFLIVGGAAAGLGWLAVRKLNDAL